MAWTLPHAYDVPSGAVWWATADLAGPLGHSAVVYAPLIAGATTVLHEREPGPVGDAQAFWRVAEEHAVESMLLDADTARSLRLADPEGELMAGHDLSRLHGLVLAGEPLDADTDRWVRDRFGDRVVDGGGEPPRPDRSDGSA